MMVDDDTWMDGGRDEMFLEWKNCCAVLCCAGNQLLVPPDGHFTFHTLTYLVGCEDHYRNYRIQGPQGNEGQGDGEPGWIHGSQSPCGLTILTLRVEHRTRLSEVDLEKCGRGHGEGEGEGKGTWTGGGMFGDCMWTGPYWMECENVGARAGGSDWVGLDLPSCCI